MKVRVKKELENMLNKAENIQNNLSQLQEKMKRIEEEILNLQSAQKNLSEQIVQFGLSSDPKKEWTEERKSEAIKYNLKLQNEKKELVKTALEGKIFTNKEGKKEVPEFYSSTYNLMRDYIEALNKASNSKK